MAKFPPSSDKDEEETEGQQSQQQGENPPPQQRTQTNPPGTGEGQMEPEDAQQQQVAEAQNQYANLSDALTVSAQALVAAARMVDQNPDVIDPASAEVIKRAMIAVSRIVMETASAEASNAPGQGAVPPPVTGAEGPGQPPSAPPAPTGAQGGAA